MKKLKPMKIGQTWMGEKIKRKTKMWNENQNKQNTTMTPATRNVCLFLVLRDGILGKGKVPLFILDNPISYLSCSS